MLAINDKWPTKINDLISVDRGLNDTERNYITNMLKVEALRLFVNLRYASDPIRYDTMKKKELEYELKYSRYD